MQFFRGTPEQNVMQGMAYLETAVYPVRINGVPCKDIKEAEFWMGQYINKNDLPLLIEQNHLA